MTFTVQRALDIVAHAGYSATSLPPLEYVNEAGRRLCNMRSWWFNQGPPRHLGVRGPVTVTNSTWTAATKILTLSAAFADYTHAHGDLFNLTSGTAATVKEYVIEEKESDNVIRLSEDIGSADAASDITGTVLANNAVILPSDCNGQLNTYTTKEGRSSHLELTSQQRFLALRADSVALSSSTYVGAMFPGQNKTDAGGEPSYRLELEPIPPATDPDLFIMSYGYRWRAMDLDNQRLSLPEFMEALYSEVLRAVVAGYEAEEEGNVIDRINQVRDGSTFADAVQHDSLMQPDFGPMRGGEEVAGSGGYFFPYTAVGDM